MLPTLPKMFRHAYFLFGLRTNISWAGPYGWLKLFGVFFFGMNSFPLNHKKLISEKIKLFFYLKIRLMLNKACSGNYFHDFANLSG